MADNVAVTAGSGTSIATDDVGGAHYQRVKLDIGGDGVSSPITSGNALPVSGTFWQATQPVSGTVTANAGSGTFAVSGTFWQATQPVSGTFWQATQPVSIATMPSTPVTGTFWQATQPVSGTVTVGNASLAVTGTFWQATQPVSIAGNQAVNLAQVAGNTTATGNGVVGTGVQRVAIASDNSPVPVTGTFNPSPTPEASATGRGRVTTFRTPGRAGTAGQKIFALHNATGSTKVVHINQIAVDLYQTVIKAITVPPPIIRVHRFTAIPTNGTALTKVTKDTSLSSNASITAWGDASADGTVSASALAVTIPAGMCLTQEFAARYITAAGYEMMDRAEFLDGKDIVLRALEGVVVELAYTVATQNPITDMWVVTADWWEV